MNGIDMSLSSSAVVSDSSEMEGSIPDKAISKIQEIMESILQKTEEEGITFYNSRETHRVFSLDIAPGLIFKMNSTKNHPDFVEMDSMRGRYQKMLKSQEVIRINKLGLLVIPKAELSVIKIGDDEYDVIVEEKIDVNPRTSMQESYFKKYSKSLDETICQLALFICKTGYSDVEWRNIPIVNGSLDKQGRRKIALIDLEEMIGAGIGLFGKYLGRRGLVRCVSADQGKLVKAVAKTHGVNMVFFKEVYNRRKKELEEEGAVQKYYNTKNIVVGDEPVCVEKSKLDFSEHPKKAEEVKDCALAFINEVNKRISKGSSEESIRERRHIHIDTSSGPLFCKDSILIDENIPSHLYETDEEYEDATFLGCVVKKLVEVGAIYKLLRRTCQGYYIQA